MPILEAISNAAEKISKIADAVESVIKLVKELNTARSLIIVIQNDSEEILTLTTQDFSGGGLGVDPALPSNEIPVGNTDIFAVVSKGGSIATGVEGTFTYEFSGMVFQIWFNNPWAGENEAHATIIGRDFGKYAIHTQVTRGDQGAKIQFILSKPKDSDSIISNSLSAAKNEDGRLELFYLGSDSRLYHNWQITPNGEWSGENILGSASNFGKAITVSQNADGRLEIFYIGVHNELYHNWQVERNANWSGEHFLEDDSIFAKELVSFENPDGRLELFYIGTDNLIYHNWEQEPGGNWKNQRLIENETGAKKIAVTQSQNGLLVLILITSDDRLFHSVRQIRGEWGSLMSLLPSTTKLKEFTVGQNLDGRLELFYVKLDGKIYHIWQESPNGRWTEELPLGISEHAKGLCVGKNEDGHLELFYIGKDYNMYHNWQVSPNGNWVGNHLFGSGYKGPKAKGLSLGQNLDGRLELFYIGLNNKIYHTWQNSPNGSWEGGTILS